MKRLLILSVFALAVAACSGDDTTTTTTTVATTTTTTMATTTTTESLPMLGDITEVAASAGSFSTLLAAVSAAGLVETLQSDGPFTVFAPTDEAFAALPEGTIEALLADIPALTDILLYHVVAGSVTSDVVVGLESAETVQGSSVSIRVEGGSVYINDSKVIAADVQASNGVIHVIDAVLLPSS